MRTRLLAGSLLWVVLWGVRIKKSPLPSKGLFYFRITHSRNLLPLPLPRLSKDIEQQYHDADNSTEVLQSYSFAQCR